MTKSRKMRKGGFWESVTSGWNSVSEGASSLWGPKKTQPSSSTSSYTSTQSSSTTPSYTSTQPSSTTPSSTPSYTPSSTSTTPYGGSRRRRRMRGGYHSKSLADHAAPFSESSTAQAKWVGGAKKTRRHKKRRSTRRH